MLVVAVLGCATAARAADPPRRLDPLQQAVVDSLASPPRTTPRQFFEAAVRCIDIDAPDVAHDYFKKFVATVGAEEKGRLDLFADLGDAFDRVKASLQGVANAVGTALAPVLLDLAGKVDLGLLRNGLNYVN
jgi:hypothetical protein